jgi:two-component system phosphate regulon sensor histidine kinase PhoR
MKRGNNVKYVLQDEIEGYGHFNNEKILIVDDNDTNLFVVKTILEDRGLIVDTALSGSEGIARFKHSGENEYRIVFLDINMYDMNGYEVSKKNKGS